MGNHMAVTVGGLQGHLELNVFKPLIAYNVLQSIRLLSDAAMSFADRAVAGLEPDRERIAALLEQSLMLVTALAPELRSEEHTSELQSLMRTSYAVFCLKNKKQQHKHKRSYTTT